MLVARNFETIREEEPMNTKLNLSLTLATGLLFTGCLFQAKDESMASARFEFKTGASAALAKGSAAGDLVIGDTTGIRITLNEALLNIKKIHLGDDSDDDTCGDGSGKSGDTAKSKDDDDCVDKSDNTVKGGPYIVNLLTGVSTPDIGTLAVPAGNYNRVKIHIHQTDGKDSGAMQDQTFLAKGTYSNKGGAEKPFTLTLKFNEVIHIRNSDGMDLDAEKLNTIVVGLNAGAWFAGLDLAKCLSTLDGSAGGAILVTEDSPFGKCLDADNVLKAKFRASFKVAKK